MTRRLPLLPTLIVLAAAAAMVALGVWQLHRKAWKEHLLATYAVNLDRPPAALAALWPVREAELYSRTGATCLAPAGWRAEAGRDVTGRSGYRHIALCRTGEGPGFAVDVGVSRSPDAPAWKGGMVRGRLTWLPSARPLIARLFGPPPVEAPMIVGEEAAPGLSPSAQPDPAAIPNNHLAYAVQWFIFAALALIIYALALRRRPTAADAMTAPRAARLEGRKVRR